jgi:hypothetical protein
MLIVKYITIKLAILKIKINIIKITLLIWIKLLDIKNNNKNN